MAGAPRTVQRLRRVVLASAGATVLLWLAAAPLAALPVGEWLIYGAAVLLLGALLVLSVTAAAQRLGQPGLVPDEVHAGLSIAGSGALWAGAFALLFRGRVGSGWAAALFCLQSGTALAAALAVTIVVHRVRAPLRALQHPSASEEPGAALSYSTSLGALATGAILSGCLVCTGMLIGHGQALGQRRAARQAADLAAIVASAAAHHGHESMRHLVRRLGAELESDGFVMLLDANGAALDAPLQPEGKGVPRLRVDGSGTRCVLIYPEEPPRPPLPCAVRALPSTGPWRIAVGLPGPPSALPFAAGSLAASLLVALLGLLLGRAGATDIARDLGRLAEDIDTLDGSKGAHGLLRPLSSPLTPEISQLQAALQRLRGRLFEEVCRYEEALARAEDADRRKTEFIGDVGRELRAPLQAILDDVRHLLSGEDGPLSDKQRDDVLIIQQGAQHLLELLRDVLDLSVLQGGLRLGRRGPVDVAQVARDLMRSMRPLINEQAVTLRLEVAEGTPAAFADASAVRRILGNLLSNAVKFTSQGEIVVEIRPEEMPAGETGPVRFVRVQVRDTGPGIPSADLRKLFTEFTQVGAARHQVGGTGLGLAIAKRLCELHGGSIDVKSALGQGSIFGFTLPAVSSEEAAA